MIGRPAHYEIRKYCLCTSKQHAEVLQNLIAQLTAQKQQLDKQLQALPATSASEHVQLKSVVTENEPAS